MMDVGAAEPLARPIELNGFRGTGSGYNSSGVEIFINTGPLPFTTSSTLNKEKKRHKPRRFSGFSQSATSSPYIASKPTRGFYLENEIRNEQSYRNVQHNQGPNLSHLSISTDQLSVGNTSWSVIQPGYGNGMNSSFQRKQSNTSIGNSSIGSTDILNEDRATDTRSLYTVLYDYDAQGEDELSVRKEQTVVVYSKDSQISGDEGWWTGRVQGGLKVGIFPSNFLAPKIQPEIIESSELVLEKLIGVGGYGEVHSAFWKRTGQVVAVKLARTDPHKAALDTIEKEASLFWMLNHPNIIKLEGVCLEQDNQCLVMEYARGGSLSRALAGRTFPLTTLVDWGIQIASGMEYLHQKGLIHRDLKSSNVLISEEIIGNDYQNKTLKISDFGLARELDKTTVLSGSGTYGWMAPEAINSHTFSHKSDVWSYGVVLWELITGEIPYKGMDMYAVVFQVGQNKLSLPIPPTTPIQFKNLLQACWNPHPHHRPTFTEILNHLQSYSVSAFFPVDSFQNLQETMKDEIQKMYEEMEKELHIMQEKVVRRESELDKKEIYLAKKELELKVKESLINFQQCSGNNRPVPNKRRGKFKRKAAKELISSPSDFRHMLSVQSRPIRSISTTDNSGSPILGPKPIFLPSDGLKGKTWGPSTAQPKERGKIIPQGKDWSRSVPDLDSVDDLEIPDPDNSDTNDIDPYQNRRRGSTPSLKLSGIYTNSDCRKLPAKGFFQKVTNFFSIAVKNKRDGRKGSNHSQTENEEIPGAFIIPQGQNNEAFGPSDYFEQEQPPTIKPFSGNYNYQNQTYHAGKTPKPTALLVNLDNENRSTASDDSNRTEKQFTAHYIQPFLKDLANINFNPDALQSAFSSTDIKNTSYSTQSPVTNESEIRGMRKGKIFTEQSFAKDNVKPPKDKTSCCPTFLIQNKNVIVPSDTISGITFKRRRNDSISVVSTNANVFYTTHSSTVSIDEYIDSHYSTEEMRQHPHPPSSYRANNSPSPGNLRNPIETFYAHRYNTDYPISEFKDRPYLYSGGVANDSMETLRGTSANLYPEIRYTMPPLASGSGESGYHGLDGFSSSSNSTTTPKTPPRGRNGSFGSRRRSPGVCSDGSFGTSMTNPSFEDDLEFLGSPYRKSSFDYSTNQTPNRISRQSSAESNDLTELVRPLTLELPRPLRSSLRKYNYLPTGDFSNSGSRNYGGTDGRVNLETTPDSDDSSYVSARDSIHSQHSSSNRVVRFSPIKSIATEKISLAPDCRLDSDFIQVSYNQIGRGHSGSNRIDFQPEEYNRVDFFQGF